MIRRIHLGGPMVISSIYNSGQEATTTMWIVWLLALIFSSTSSQAQYCHSTDPKPYIFYGTKTPYELINNEDSSPVRVSGTVTFLPQLQHFWTLKIIKLMEHLFL